MSDGSIDMGRRLSAMGHAGNSYGGEGGSGHVLEAGITTDVREAVDKALGGSGLWALVGTFALGAHTLPEIFKTGLLSLGTLSQSFANLGTLPSPLANLPKPSNLLGKGGGKGA